VCATISSQCARTSKCSNGNSRSAPGNGPSCAA
jgi:hypothetical protein